MNSARCARASGASSGGAKPTASKPSASACWRIAALISALIAVRRCIGIARPSTAAGGGSSATVLKSVIGLPQDVVSDECIEDDYQLSHGGDQGDLGGFAGVSEAAVKALQGRIEADGDQGGHVEGAADAVPSAGDMTFAAAVSAVL